MRPAVKMVAVDIDGTFVRSDYTYDVPRFRRLLARMQAAGCRFVVASGNQYYQLRDLFPGCAAELAFVAENGALVKDRDELVFTASIPKETVDFDLRNAPVLHQHDRIDERFPLSLHTAFQKAGAAEKNDGNRRKADGEPHEQKKLAAQRKVHAVSPSMRWSFLRSPSRVMPRSSAALTLRPPESSRARRMMSSSAF